MSGEASYSIILVPGAGIEPARLAAGDFEFITRTPREQRLSIKKRLREPVQSVDSLKLC